MSHPDGNPSSSYDQSSSWMKSFPPTTRDKNKCVSEDSDEEDLFTVPDIEAAARPTTESSAAGKAIEGSQLNNTTSLAANVKRRRGRNPADREYRRLKRLLRNRVSAQQARERKKAYVNDLESKAKDLQDKNSNLEEKISTLINENTMLRKVLMNTRPKVDESSDSKQDQSVRADS